METIQLLEQSNDEQSSQTGNSGYENINLERDEIPTINLTNDAVIYYVGDNIPIENQTGNKKPSCESAQDTNSKFSSVINKDNIIIQDIITNHEEWESEFSTA